MLVLCCFVDCFGIFVGCYLMSFDMFIFLLCDDSMFENVNLVLLIDVVLIGMFVVVILLGVFKYFKFSMCSVVIMIVIVLFGIVLILCVWLLWLFDSICVSIDNVYVCGQIIVFVLQVNGYVIEVLVKDFQYVCKGDVLVCIDDCIYKEKVVQVQVDLDSVLVVLVNFDQIQVQNCVQIVVVQVNFVVGQSELL